MKAAFACLVGLALFQGPAVAQIRGVDLGLSASAGTLKDFYLAISDHYNVPPLHVVELRERYGCPDEDLPIVYFLAARAHVAPASIISLRVQHVSWLDITFQLRLTPDIFFVPVRTDRIGPPYGNAYGYYRKHAPSRDWKKMALSDRDVAALVNLRFMSEYYGLPPESVMAMRSRENDFVAVNDEIKRGKAQTANPKAKKK